MPKGLTQNEVKEYLKTIGFELIVCIEYDGIQHFEPIERFGGKEEFSRTKIRDNIKTQYCKDNNIKLIRIPYWDFDNIEMILKKQF